MADVPVRAELLKLPGRELKTASKSVTLSRIHTTNHPHRYVA